MPAPKLKDGHREALKAWLCEGLSNGDCIDNLKTEFGIDVTPPAINYYRDQCADQIAEAEAAAYKRIIQQGMTRRSERIKALAAEATRAYSALQQFKPGQKGWAQASAEWRALVKDLRDEMNQLTQRIEISGPGGGPVQVVPIFAPEDPMNHINEDNDNDSGEDDGAD